MSKYKSKELAAFDSADSSTTPTPSANAYDAKLRRFTATIDMANGGTAIAAGDSIDIARVKKGLRFAFATIITPASLGDSTISVSARHIDPETKQEAVEAGKYCAARTITTPQQPIMLGANSAGGERLYDEVISLDVAASPLPTSGTLVVDMYFSAV